MSLDFKEEKKQVLGGLDKLFWAVLAALFLLYLASGAFVVEANEQAVLFRFGEKQDSIIRPGIGYHWPWPVETVRKVNVREMQGIEVGFWPRSNFGDSMTPYCITGDKNIIHNRYVIQYRIGDPANYLVRGARVKEMLHAVAQATLLEVVAGKKVAPVLTTGKNDMEREFRARLSEKLKDLNIAITIVGVERQAAEPPNLVKDAFQDVINAQEEKQTRIHEAENYENQELPRAKGDAERVRKEADGYKFRIVKMAEGDSDRFNKLHEQYLAAPEVTRHRLFIETLEKVLPRVRVMVLARDKNGEPIRVKVLQTPVPTFPRLPSQ